jgi:hypothetical protein
MATTKQTPTFFDKMHGFDTLPNPVNKDSSKRYYLCTQQPSGYTCHRGTHEETLQEHIRIFGGNPYNVRCRVVDVSIGCPVFNDQLVLSYKLGSPVRLGKPLSITDTTQ